MRFRSQPPRFDPRFFQADHGRVGRFLRGHIFACAFSQLLRGLCDVENVVDNLKRQAERATECRNRRQLLNAGIGRHRTQTNGSGQERCGFVFVDETQLRPIDAPALCFKIGHLPRDQFPASRRDGDFAKDLAEVISLGALHVRRNFERDRQQRVTGQNGDPISENFVGGRAATAKIVVVHTGEIVMHE